MSIWRYDPGEGRKKHAWSRDEAGFEPLGKGPVGKCPVSISPEKAESLLNEGLPVYEDGDEKVRKQIGDAKTLQVDLELFSDAEHPRSMIWGNLTLTLNCEPVWYTETEHGDVAPVSWAWIDLLEFLGNKWPWLILEERYPISINPLHPGTMRREAEKRWESMGEEQYLDEDETLFHFEARHDLSQGLKGIFLPSLFVLRQGKKVWLYSQETHLLSSLEAIKDTLSQLGDYLAGYISGVQDNRAERAVCRWEEREKRVDELFWELRTGMHRELREKLENGVLPAEFWELDHSRDL